jgi:hypothetical protein
MLLLTLKATESLLKRLQLNTVVTQIKTREANFSRFYLNYFALGKGKVKCCAFIFFAC